jgi:hypothetical protein
MLRIPIGFLVATLLVAPAARAEEPSAEVQVELAGATPGLTLDVFRGTLSEQGEWHRSPTWGDVWRPRVELGWRPYFYGSWAWSDEGWYWDSAEPFAWAVYHYGRWVFDPGWGWVWVPGYEWAPAWVTWRYGADAVGWAPLAPGVSVFVTSYPFVEVWWTFVPTPYFVGRPIQTVAYGPREVPRWYRDTAPAPPRTLAAPRAGATAPGTAPAWGGPSRRAIEERVGRPIQPMHRSPAAAPERRGPAGSPGWEPAERRGAPAARGEPRVEPPGAGSRGRTEGRGERREERRDERREERREPRGR